MSRPSFKNLFTNKPYGYWKRGDLHPILKRTFLGYKDSSERYPEKWVKTSKYSDKIPAPSLKVPNPQKRLLEQINTFNKNWGTKFK